MRPSHSKFLLLPIVVAAMVLGCGRKPFPGKVDNQLPEVRLTAAPIDTTGRYFYSYLMDWVGYDPDRRVDHYLYAIDPPSEAEAETDTEWVTTRDNEKRIQFNSTQPIPAAADDPHRFAQDPHTFVIKAIDNKGAEGPSVYRSFFSFTEAPDVNLLNPPPGPFENPVLTPSVRFTWGGIDRDGVQTSKPVQYKFLLLSDASAFPIQLAINNPDSLRRYYAPHFVGWEFHQRRHHRDHVHAPLARPSLPVRGDRVRRGRRLLPSVQAREEHAAVHRRLRRDPRSDHHDVQRVLRLHLPERRVLRVPRGRVRRRASGRPAHHGQLVRQAAERRHDHLLPVDGRRRRQRRASASRRADGPHALEPLQLERPVGHARAILGQRGASPLHRGQG